MVDYVDITPTSRLMIDADLTAPDPRLDECVTGTYTPPNWWGAPQDGPLPKFEFPGNLAMAHSRLYDPRSWAPERRVQRWAWANFNLHVECHGMTYWWCDQAMFETMVGGEFTRDMQEQIIGADVREYERWDRGEARVITLQRKGTFKRLTKRRVSGLPDLYEVWEDITSEGNLYLADYTPGQAALDFFADTLTKKELAVVTAMIDNERVDR